MHIEILVEDSSGEKLLQVLLPQLIGTQGDPHTWRLHSYKGIGRIPSDLVTKADPAKRILLDQLPKLLRGYGKTPGSFRNYSPIRTPLSPSCTPISFPHTTLLFPHPAYRTLCGCPFSLPFIDPLFKSQIFLLT